MNVYLYLNSVQFRRSLSVNHQNLKQNASYYSVNVISVWLQRQNFYDSNWIHYSWLHRYSNCIKTVLISSPTERSSYLIHWAVDNFKNPLWLVFGRSKINDSWVNFAVERGLLFHFQSNGSPNNRRDYTEIHVFINLRILGCRHKTIVCLMLWHWADKVIKREERKWFLCTPRGMLRPKGVPFSC